MLEILDITLREGEQTPYVNSLLDEKLEIVRLLDKVGVEMIEAGNPSVPPSTAAAIQKVKECGVKRVVVLYPTSQMTHTDLEYKLRFLGRVQ
jgi:isopropylmalate/homocitrate/citramalate synthase